MNCYFSTGCFLTQALKAIVSLGLEHNLDIELSSSVAHAPDNVDSVRKAKGQIRFLVHNYFPPPSEPFVLNLASTDPVGHRQSVGLCRQGIDLCAEVGAPFYSVHAGFAFHLTPEMLGDPMTQSKIDPALYLPREKAYAIFVETVRELSKYARKKNIQLLIENNVLTGELLRLGRKPPLFLADIEEIGRFFADINDPNIGLLLDAGHAKVTATSLGLRPESFFEVLSPYVRALHLSDNAGIRDTHQRLHKHVWFAPFLKDFSQYPIVIETCRSDIEANLDQRNVLVELMTGP